MNYKRCKKCGNTNHVCNLSSDRKCAECTKIANGEILYGFTHAPVHPDLFNKQKELIK